MGEDGMQYAFRLFLGFVVCATTSSAQADQALRPYELTEERELCKDYEPLRRPFFGDTHVHTTYSFDANGQDTRNTPSDAYRFAKGDEVGIQPFDVSGKALRSAKLRRPLDFTAVTDHAEMLGEVRICTDKEADGYGSDLCWLYRLMPSQLFGPMAMRVLIQRERFGYCGENDLKCLEQAAIVWRDIQVAADQAYDRSPECSFTSFVGYEWTGSIGSGINLHRNVIFRNEHVPVYAPSWIETPSAFDLWSDLQRRCIEGVPGCDVLTIPHNSNLSGPGIIFESAKLKNVEGASIPVTQEEAALRQRWEPLVEIMQHKGDSECLLGGDTTDEGCGFEKLPYNSFAGVGRVSQASVLSPGGDLSPDRRATVREALKKGLLLEAELGQNPLKYGIVASTDSHLGTPGLVIEDDPKGHGGAGDMQLSGLPDNIEFNPGGLAVLWAEENTRDSLFSAMQRREAYGTSGTRPVVRFFGGWRYPSEMCDSGTFVEAGYEGGVAMGGDLTPRPEGAEAPRFAISALKDPGSQEYPGTPLQKIQVVKGWTQDGQTYEKVFDVAGGANGASVDVLTCETRGEKSDSLCAVWEDPDFDSDERAFYYVRVLENPTCRWSQQLCVEASVSCDDPAQISPGFEACCSSTVPKVVQERAWTSPIWYSP